MSMRELLGEHREDGENMWFFKVLPAMTVWLGLTAGALEIYQRLPEAMQLPRTRGRFLLTIKKVPSADLTQRIRV